jgi:hypothetical protein
MSPKPSSDAGRRAGVFIARRWGVRVSDQPGFVTLAAIIIVAIVGLVAALLYTSLLGDVQGAVGSRQSIAALSVAEAGANWAGNKLGGSGASTYTGDIGQAVQSAGGQQVGAFDVAVTCTDGTAVNTGCPAQPNSRLISSTGYVPYKALPLAKRKVQIVVNETVYSAVNFAICGYNGVILQPHTTIQGNVGSEGTAPVDLTVGSGAAVQAGGGLPGNISMVTTASCGTCAGQVAGSVNPNQAAGTICPNKTNVVNSYSCTPGATNWAGGDLTINSSNASWGNIVLGSNTLTFDTTGLPGPLVVQVNSISATGPGNTVVIKGGGRVQLVVNGTTNFGPSTAFGRDFATGNPVSANRMVLESCSSINTGVPFDIFFGPSGWISGVIVDPNGYVQVNPSNVLQGGVLAGNIQTQPSTGYAYDSAASGIGFGSQLWTKLVSWQDVP